MAVRRNDALDEFAIAVAEATVDAWLAGDIVGGQHNNIDEGTKHETADESKAPPKRRTKSTKKT